MTPEEKARQKIDQWFSDAGWKVVDRDEYGSRTGDPYATDRQKDF